MTMLLLAIILVTVSAACGKREAANIAHSAAASYNTSYRDGVIKNRQAKVADMPRCANLKEKFRAVAARYNGAATGAFQIDMIKIWEEVKAARCQYSHI